MIKKQSAVVYIVLVTLLMTLPLGSANINNTFVVGFRFDYVIHCVIYLPWMFLCGSRKSLLWLLAGVGVAAVLEFAQYFIPYRGFNVNDIIAGVVGVLVSYFCALIYIKIKTNINEQSNY